MTIAMYAWPGQPLSGEQPARHTRPPRRAAMGYLDSATQGQEAIIQDGGSAATSVTLTSPDLLMLLERLYVLPQRSAVLAFLSGRPHLVALLLEAHLYLRLYFQDVQCVLNLHENPESSIEQVGLAILVPADHPERAIAQMEAFDEGWWLDAMDRAFGELFITITAA